MKNVALIFTSLLIIGSLQTAQLPKAHVEVHACPEVTTIMERVAQDPWVCCIDYHFEEISPIIQQALKSYETDYGQKFTGSLGLNIRLKLFDILYRHFQDKKCIAKILQFSLNQLNSTELQSIMLRLSSENNNKHEKEFMIYFENDLKLTIDHFCVKTSFSKELRDEIQRIAREAVESETTKKEIFAFLDEAKQVPTLSPDDQGKYRELVARMQSDADYKQHIYRAIQSVSSATALFIDQHLEKYVNESGDFCFDRIDQQAQSLIRELTMNDVKVNYLQVFRFIDNPHLTDQECAYILDVIQTQLQATVGIQTLLKSRFRFSFSK